LRYSVNTRGQRRTTASIPGTGISYTETSSNSRRKNYKSSSYQRQNQLEKQKSEQEKLQELEINRLEVELFENKLEMIRSIHIESDEIVDWNKMKNTEPPFYLGEKGPKELVAINQLNSYKPNFFAKLFKQDEKRRRELENAIRIAYKEDNDDYQEWEALIQMANRILNGDIDAYYEVIEEFAPLDDLSEFGSSFEFLAEQPDIIEVELDVQTKNVIPTEIKSLTKTGKVSVKKMPISRYYDIQQDYICSCVLRIARDMFALLPLKTIYIHALDEQLNTSNGHMDNVVILSIKIEKSELNELNFESIDCSDSLSNFQHNMNFRKTKGFGPIERISPVLHTS
jgi:hypothetical protein